MPPTAANTLFPAASNGEFNLPLEDSIVIDRGAGHQLWDTEGRRFIDFSMGWGSALVGHAQPLVVDAVRKALNSGCNFSYITANSLRLAEKLHDLSPAMDQVRFCASGTEATYYCIRIARAATGRSTVLKFEGAYHGSHAIGTTSLFPADPPPFPQATAGCHGSVDESRDVLTAPFNDAEAVREIIDQHHERLGCVIMEPLQRCLPPKEGFLEQVREITAAHQIPLIFDEVVTGFRLAYGGAQEYYGVVPDLVAYGKALGGGMPIGAYGGRRELMDVVREDRMNSEQPYVWSASSTGGNPVSAAASLAVLDVLSDVTHYQYLHDLGTYFRRQLQATIDAARIEAKIIGDGPLAQMIFTSEQPIDYRSSQHQQPKLAREVMLGLFREQVFLNPMGTKLYLSLAHDRGVCDEFCERLKRVLSSSTVRS